MKIQLTKEQYLEVAKTVHWSLTHGEEFKIVKEKSFNNAKEKGYIILSNKEKVIEYIDYVYSKRGNINNSLTKADLWDEVAIIKRKVEAIEEKE